MAALRHDPQAPVPTTEVFGPSVSPIPSEDPWKDLTGRRIPKISYGLPFDKAILNHTSKDARVYIISSKTLSENMDCLQRLKNALGDRVKGVRIGMTPHSIFQECLEVIAAVKEADADTVITLGGGSLTDAAKLVVVGLANEIHTIEDLKKHQPIKVGGRLQLPKVNPVTANLIFIPTTLSAGEHTPFSGITDRETKQKHMVCSTQSKVIILDPEMCLHTPESVWIQTGVRGIDHCVEGTMSPEATPELQKITIQALKQLATGLIECKNDKEGSNVKARLNCQIGVALAIIPVVTGLPCGASHGIGHVMGPMGVGHGETSCILLPSVCKYNAKVTEDRQALLRKALWEVPACKQLFDTKGLVEDHTDLGDLLDQIIRALDMPRTLKEKGIVGEKKKQLAKASLKDAWLATNPIPVTTEEQVMEILDMCTG